MVLSGDSPLSITFNICLGVTFNLFYSTTPLDNSDLPQPLESNEMVGLMSVSMLTGDTNNLAENFSQTAFPTLRKCSSIHSSAVPPQVDVWIKCQHRKCLIKEKKSFPGCLSSEQSRREKGVVLQLEECSTVIKTRKYTILNLAAVISIYYNQCVPQATVPVPDLLEWRCDLPTVGT